MVARDGSRVPERRGSADRPGPVHKAELTLHGRRIAYRTGGSGPLLLLIHGITSNSATWDKVLGRLARRYTVLAPDLLGHGRSDKLRDDYSVGAHANTMRDLLDELGHGRATLVGHSLGGGVAMQMAYQYPERVERLVLVAPGGFGPEVSPLLRAASVPGSGRVIALAAWRPIVQAGTVIKEALGKLGLHGGTDLEEVARAYALLADPGARAAFLHTLRGVVDHHGQRVAALHRIGAATRHPSLIIWGGRDRIVPLRHGERARELVGNGELQVFADAGHFPHRDDPERFVTIVEDFLARHTRRSTARARPRGARGAVLGTF